MIKLFRNIRQTLLNEDKTTKYFKYAIGEIVLVVIGILIALQVNNWNEERIAKKETKAYHERLKEDLRLEMAFLSDRVTYYSAVRDHGKNVVEALTTHPDSLGSDFLISTYQATQQWILREVRDTYDELISTGNIKLIPNPKLRKRLARYYQETQAYNIYWSVTTDYREIVRKHMPYDLQKKIQETCEIWTDVDQETGGNMIIENCTLVLSPEEITRGMAYLSYDYLLDNNTLLLSANRLVNDVELKVGLFKRKLKGAEILLTMMEQNNP